MKVLLAAFEHAFNVPALPILADDFFFIHAGICAQEADPFLPFGAVREIDQLDRYPLDDFIFLLHEKVHIDAKFPCGFATAFFAHDIQGLDVDHFSIILVILL